MAALTAGFSLKQIVIKINKNFNVQTLSCLLVSAVLLVCDFHPAPPVNLPTIRPFQGFYCLYSSLSKLLDQYRYNFKSISRRNTGRESRSKLSWLPRRGRARGASSTSSAPHCLIWENVFPYMVRKTNFGALFSLAGKHSSQKTIAFCSDTYHR